MFEHFLLLDQLQVDLEYGIMPLLKAIIVQCLTQPLSTFALKTELMNEGRLREWIQRLFSRCELIMIRPLERFIKALTGKASDVQDAM